MVEQVIKLPRSLPGGDIVAVNISEDDYMRDFAESHHEWKEGVVTSMSPVSARHDDLTGYLREFFRTYFALRQIGVVKNAPFVMRLDTVKSRREPDLQIILNDNPGKIEENYMDGPADICIEVVSPGSETVDYGTKLSEYEQGGVREYWIIDPIREHVTLYRLNGRDRYQQIQPENGTYNTPLLPDLKFTIDTLWQETLPDIITTVKTVQAMLKDE